MGDYLDGLASLPQAQCSTILASNRSVRQGQKTSRHPVDSRSTRVLILQPWLDTTVWKVLVQYLLLALAIAVLAVIYGRIWLRRHRTAPLRHEIRAREITFRSGLDRVRVTEPALQLLGTGSAESIRSPMELIVRGDAFEISSTSPFGRMVMGMEYYFRARETSVEIRRPIPRLLRMDGEKEWIVVQGRQAGKEIQLWIMKKNLNEVWTALVDVGAVPRSAGPSALET